MAKSKKPVVPHSALAKLYKDELILSGSPKDINPIRRLPAFAKG